jgi:hypothetical protein
MRTITLSLIVPTRVETVKELFVGAGGSRPKSKAILKSFGWAQAAATENTCYAFK